MNFERKNINNFIIKILIYKNVFIVDTYIYFPFTFVLLNQFCKY